MKKENEIKIAITKNEYKKFLEEFFGKKDLIYEITYGFFKPDMSNVETGIFPRIKHRITPSSEAYIGMKIKNKDKKSFYFEREEFEVSFFPGHMPYNVDNMRKIIKTLGFSKEIIFEKIRHCSYLENCVITLDFLPFGHFMEIEGAPNNIKRCLKTLKMTDREMINGAYLKLWDEYKQKKGISQENCHFNPAQKKTLKKLFPCHF